MFAARDQENLIHGHQQVAASKPLNQGVRALPPKTPGNKYPKTPLKLPLNDENAPGGFGGKSVLGTKGKGVGLGPNKGGNFDKNAFVTPMGPRTRAPLGMKTTNAKTKGLQNPGAGLEKELDKTQLKPASSQKPKPKIHQAETIKLNIHGDEVGPLEDRDVEYAAPRPKYPAYDSEDFPRDSLNFKVLEGPNLMRGFHKHYFNPVDENGISLKEKEYEAALTKSYKETDARVLKALEDMEWTVGDVPETFAHLRKKKFVEPQTLETVKQVKKASVPANKGPATIASRRAASALSVLPTASAPVAKPSKPVAALKAPSFLVRGKKNPAPAPVNPSTMRHTAAAAASRSTIGYNKGRSASNALNIGPSKRGLPRSISNLSTGSDTTITPARYAQRDLDEDSDEWMKLKFLGAFDVDDEDLEPCLRGGLPECLRRDEDAEEEFVLELGIM